MKKLIGQDMNTKSSTFGKYIYKDMPVAELVELYAEYRVVLALAIQQGSGVPFIRTFKEWLNDEPLEII